MGKGLPPNVVDIRLLPLDQHSPVTEGPVGRLSGLVNTQIKQYQRGDDGNTHMQIKKRNGFRTYTTDVRNAAGGVLGGLTGPAQCYWAENDKVHYVGGNRLFTLSNAWVQSFQSDGADTIVMPHTLRQDVIYTADSQVTAPDHAVIGAITCSVWTEQAHTLDNNAAANADWFASGTATASNGTRVELRNETTKTFVRAPFSLRTSTETYAGVKVVTDGTFFYVFQGRLTPSTAIRVTTFNVHGQLQATTTITSSEAGVPWDVTVMPDVGVLLAVPHSGDDGLTIYNVQYTVLGGFVTPFVSDSTIKCSQKQCYWLTNDFSTNLSYLVTLDDDGISPSWDIWAYRIKSDLTMDHTYPKVANVGTVAGKWISCVSGWAKSGTNVDLRIAYTAMDRFGLNEKTIYGTGTTSGENLDASNNFPDQTNNVVVTRAVPYTNPASTLATRLSMSLVSRAFKIGNDYVAVGYYASRKWGPLTDPGSQVTPFDPTRGAPHFPFRVTSARDFQPTWFILPLESTQFFCGRFEYGSASADWQIVYPNSATSGSPTFNTYTTNRIAVSPAVFASGRISIPLPYRAEFTGDTQARVTTLLDVVPGGQPASLQANLIPNSPNLPAPNVNQQSTSTAAVGNLPSSTIGLKQFYIGPDYGQPFDVGGVQYIPGLMAGLLEGGDFTEHGMLAPECPQVVVHGGTTPDGGDDQAGPYIYALTAENTTLAGNNYKSLVSPAFSFVFSPADDNDVNQVGLKDVSPTLYPHAILSIYRTGVRENTPSQALFKITSDLQPLYNDPSGAGIFRSFDDYLGIGTQQSGEILYLSRGELPHFPAPAHRGGCVWQNRIWLIGYDNALWFSNDLVENEGAWFNPGLRTPAQEDEIVKIVPLDQTLLVFCRNSIKRIEAAAFPNNAGVGVAPVLFDLPFESGCTGFAVPTRIGALYTSSAGSVWLITRQMTNLWVGEGADDYLTEFDLTGMEVDGKNRVIVNNGQYLIVYDITAQTWMRWDTVTEPDLIAIAGGQTTYVHSGLAWVMDPSLFYDVDTSGVDPVLSHVQMFFDIAQMHVGNIRGWKRTWALQIQGTVDTDCYFNALLSYNDSSANPMTFFQKQAFEGLMQFEVNPIASFETHTSLGLAVWDSVTGTAGDARTFDVGAGFVVDIVSLYMGMEKGLKKLPAANRIPGAST